MADVVLQKYCTTDNIRMLLFRKKVSFSNILLLHLNLKTSILSSLEGNNKRREMNIHTHRHFMDISC